MSAEIWAGAGAEVAALRERIEQLEAQLASYEARAGFMSAEDMVRNARAWVSRNPDVWDKLKARARAAVSEQRRFSIKREMELLREEAGISRQTVDFKISNSLSAVLVRLLIQRIPGLAEVTTVRPSKVDGVLKWR